MGNPSPIHNGKSNGAVLYAPRPGEEAPRDGAHSLRHFPTLQGPLQRGMRRPPKELGLWSAGGSAQPGPWRGCDQQRL